MEIMTREKQRAEIRREGGGPDLLRKLEILTDAAKYDVSCTSSGVERKGNGKTMGNTVAGGICHAFGADGRCISLLKILMTNECVFDCKYCINRSSNDVKRARFTPEEICELTMEFYRRNYIEGLFLSSGVYENPNTTMELMYQTLFLLRRRYRFNGYVHVKAIPGADPRLIELTGWLADRMSVNLELPTADGLKKLAPHKSRNTILKPMRQIQLQRQQGPLLESRELMPLHRREVGFHRNTAQFVPAGQSSQLIIGAGDETDYQILNVAESLYGKFDLKRVFYSAFIRVNDDSALPEQTKGPPLLREHRLYQADWLLRFYGFKAGELLNETKPNFNVLLDPKCDWALNHLEQFPVEINRADYHTLLRVPGIGVKSARKIVAARRACVLDYPDLKKIGVVMKRAVYFITCRGKQLFPIPMEQRFILGNLLSVNAREVYQLEEKECYEQLSLFDDREAGSAGIALTGLEGSRESRFCLSR